jgi:hypothetical protein
MHSKTQSGTKALKEDLLTSSKKESRKDWKDKI